MKTAVFLLTLVLVLLFPVNTFAETSIELQCKSALLMDGTSGEILYELNSQDKCYPASVTKIMTLVLIFEAIEAQTISMEDEVMVSEAAASMGGSQVYLYAGEKRTVDEMLVAIAVGSGNDASYAMAEYISGSMPDFIDLMNNRAQQLGMTNTHFVNSHGLHDENHYTSAHDLGLLAYHSLSLSKFLDYTSIYEYEFRPEPKLLTLWNTNRLLKWYEGTDGIKTGYTEEAGRNLVTTVNRDGMRMISVIMGATERQGHFNESMKLLNYGFNKFEYVSIHKAGEIICEAPVSKGKSESVGLVLARDIGYSTEKGQNSKINEKMEIISTLQAPLHTGDIGGKLVIYKDDTEFITADLLIAEDMEKGGFFLTWRKLLRTMW